MLPPQGVVGNDHGVADAVIDVQLLAGLPAILREDFVHAAAEDGVGALAEFGVGVEQAERGIGDGVARGGQAGAACR